LDFLFRRNNLYKRNTALVLGIGRDFSTWIKGRIKDFSFEENQGFVISLSFRKNAGRPTVEYHINLDMAKELAMDRITSRILRTPRNIGYLFSAA
jgi:phage anti-repressor protein